MMKINLYYSVLVLLVLCSNVTSYLYPYEPRGPLAGTPAPLGSIWPKPVFHYKVPEYFAVDTSNFEIVVFEGDRRSESSTHSDCEEINWAVEHYKEKIRSLKPANGSIDIGISVLRIYILSCYGPATQYPNTTSIWDELSDIVIERDYNDQPIASMEVNRVWGAIRGLENFYQMLWPADETYTVYNINATEVIDWPRFLHRGVMIDTARHYLPEETITDILTAMMYNKFNVLHWHITDDQSFPYVSEKFPELSEQGKYHRNAVYTPEAVHRIIEAARVRGIRVMFEFDTPGHVGGFGKSHPELLTKCGLPNIQPLAERENFDPSNEQVYTFMQEFFTEFVQNVTKDRYVHLGMDEVYFPCWESSPDIQNFMLANGLANMSQVQGYYTQRHVKMVQSLNVTAVAWQDPLDDGTELDPSVVIHVWKSGPWEETMKKALEKGHNVILSACWYINLVEYGETWRKYYECDPILGKDYQQYKNQILGGEAAIWGEYIDQTNIMATLFPYASAVASVLWDTNREWDDDWQFNTDDAMWKLDYFRCSLLRRGVRAQPILNGYCGPFEVDLDM